jgi:hypothetical protein
LSTALQANESGLSQGLHLHTATQSYRPSKLRPHYWYDKRQLTVDFAVTLIGGCRYTRILRGRPVLTSFKDKANSSCKLRKYNTDWPACLCGLCSTFALIASVIWRRRRRRTDAFGLAEQMIGGWNSTFSCSFAPPPFFLGGGGQDEKFTSYIRSNLNH